jgi:putative flippase GtrA
MPLRSIEESPLDRNRLIHRSRSLFAGATNNTLVQLFRYTFVGGIAFVVDFAALFLLAEFCKIPYLVSAALAFLLGVTTNYAISVIWVFDKRTVRSRGTEFAIFALLGIVGLGINEVSMYGLTEFAGLHYLLSKIVSTVITYAWNFLSRKAILFTIPAEDWTEVAQTDAKLPLGMPVSPAE